MTQNTQPTVLTKPRKRNFIQDVYSGAIHGDFADNLGVPGKVTQIIFALIPFVGSACAVRDYIACRRKRDRLGQFLNLLAFIPLLGVFPETLKVVRHGGSIVRTVNEAQKSKKNHESQ